MCSPTPCHCHMALAPVGGEPSSTQILTVEGADSVGLEYGLEIRPVAHPVLRDSLRGLPRKKARFIALHGAAPASEQKAATESDAL